MLFKRAKHRVFDYPPRHYKPEQDESEKRKKKLDLEIKRSRVIQRRKSPLKFIIVIALLIYLLIELQKCM